MYLNHTSQNSLLGVQNELIGIQSSLFGVPERNNSFLWTLIEIAPVEKRGKTLKPYKMASINEEGVIEKFVRPARCLYSEYSISIDKFKEENGLLLAKHDLEDLGEDASFELYGEFSEDHDGELARESVQTWICDNRLEVSNCIRIALENRKEAFFCNWFRKTE